MSANSQSFFQNLQNTLKFSDSDDSDDETESHGPRIKLLGQRSVTKTPINLRIKTEDIPVVSDSYSSSPVDTGISKSLGTLNSPIYNLFQGGNGVNTNINNVVSQPKIKNQQHHLFKSSTEPSPMEKLFPSDPNPNHQQGNRKDSTTKTNSDTPTSPPILSRKKTIDINTLFSSTLTPPTQIQSQSQSSSTTHSLPLPLFNEIPSINDPAPLTTITEVLVLPKINHSDVDLQGRPKSSSKSRKSKKSKKNKNKTSSVSESQTPHIKIKPPQSKNDNEQSKNLENSDFNQTSKRKKKKKLNKKADGSSDPTKSSGSASDSSPPSETSPKSQKSKKLKKKKKGEKNDQNFEKKNKGKNNQKNKKSQYIPIIKGRNENLSSSTSSPTPAPVYISSAHSSRIDAASLFAPLISYTFLQYPRPTFSLDEAIQDVAVRFILHAPPEDSTNFTRLFFHIEEAHWYYVDEYLPRYDNLPNLSLLDFAKYLFAAFPLMQDWFPHVDGLFFQFQKYKSRIPVCGSIIITPDFQYLLLVRGNRPNWSFPKGKINKEETPLECAVRETREEISFDITPFVQNPMVDLVTGTIPRSLSKAYKNLDNNSDELYKDFLEASNSPATRHLQTKITLFIAWGVPLTTPFLRSKDEIEEVTWRSIDEIPISLSQATRKEKKTLGLIIPFMNSLRQWIHNKRNQLSFQKSPINKSLRS